MRTWASPRLGVLAGIVVLVLTGTLLFAASLRDPGYVRLGVEAGRSGAAGAHSGARTFVVQAAPFSQVELRVNGRRMTSAYVPGNAREVRFEETPLDDGRNEVVARATLWYAAVRRVHDATLVVNGAPSRRAGGPLGASPPAAFPGDRLLALDVHYQEAAAAFTVRLARTDPAAIAIVKGRVDTPAFVDDVFGSPEFNDAPLARYFSGVRPHVDASGDGVTIRAESGMRRPGLEQLPAFVGTIEIADDFTAPRVLVTGVDAPRRAGRDARQWAHDTLRIAVADYRVDDPLPVPFRRNGDAYVWERPFADGHRSVAAELTYTPFASVVALRRGLNLPVFAFVHPIAARFLAFGNGFLLAIPMFAYLVLSKRRNPRFATIARRLIVVAVAADVFNACISSQPDVNLEIPLIAPALHGLTTSLLTQLVVPAVIGLVLAVIAWSVAHLARHVASAAGVLAFEAAHAVSVAGAAYAAVSIIGYAAGGFGRAPGLYPVVVDVLLAGAFLGLLRALGWWSLPGESYRTAFTAATVACALAVAFPFSLVHYGVWATSATLAATGFANAVSPASLTTEFLRVLGTAAPAAFGLLLLRGMRSPQAGAGLSAEQFARIAFCTYAVDASGVIVLVPISFILAWTTFGRLCAAVRPDVAGAVPPGLPGGNGRSVLPLALAFAAAEVALFVWFAAPHLGELHTPFVALEAAVFVAAAVVSFVVPAVAFGEWHARDGRAHALRRAVATAVWVIGCSFPAWFLRLESTGSIVAMVLLTAAFYFALGVFYDAPAVREKDAHEARAT